MDAALGGDGIHNSLDLSLETGTLWCENCLALKKDIEKLENQHTKSFQTLKEKIISTDLLIKKYKAKCDDYDNQAKQLEETQKKLQHIQRQAETLEAQLRTSLQETEPLKQKKTALETENRQKTLEIEILTDKIKSVEKTCQQYQLLSQSSSDQNEKYETEKQIHLKKIQSLQNSNQKQEAQLEKFKVENKALKSENSRYGIQQRKLEAKLKQTMEKIDLYFRILKENGLLPKGEKKLKLDAKLTSFSTTEPYLFCHDEGSLLEEVSKELAEVVDSSSEDDDDLSLCSLPWTFSPVIKLLSPLPPTPECLIPFIHDEDDDNSMLDIAIEIENELIKNEKQIHSKECKEAPLNFEKKKTKRKVKKQSVMVLNDDNSNNFENIAENVGYENFVRDGNDAVINTNEIQACQDNVDTKIPKENLSDSESTDLAEDSEEVVSFSGKGIIRREDTEGFSPVQENVEVDKSVSAKSLFDFIKDEGSLQNIELGVDNMLLKKEMEEKGLSDEEKNSAVDNDICKIFTANEEKELNTCTYVHDRYKKSESSTNKGLLQRQRAFSGDVGYSNSECVQVSVICDKDNNVQSVVGYTQFDSNQKTVFSKESDAVSTDISVNPCATNSFEFLMNTDSKKKSDVKENVSLQDITATESKGKEFLLSHTNIDFPVPLKEENKCFFEDRAFKRDFCSVYYSSKQSGCMSNNGSILEMSEQDIIKEKKFMNELVPKLPAESVGNLSINEISSAKQKHTDSVSSSILNNADRINIKSEPYVDENIQDIEREGIVNSLQDAQMLEKVQSSMVIKHESEVLVCFPSSDSLGSGNSVSLDINDKQPKQENMSSLDIFNTSDEENDHENKENLKILFENKKLSYYQDLKNSDSPASLVVLTRNLSKKHSQIETGRRETMIGNKRTLTCNISSDLSVQDRDQSEFDVSKRNKRSRLGKPKSSVDTDNEEENVLDNSNDDSGQISPQIIKKQISVGFDITQFESTKLKDSTENDKKLNAGDMNSVHSKNSNINISICAKEDIHDEYLNDWTTSHTVTNDLISSAAMGNIDNMGKETVQNEHTSLTRPINLKLSHIKENSILCYNSTCPNAAVSNAESIKSSLLGLPSSSMYLSPEIENITASSALMVKSQSVAIPVSLISPSTTATGTPGFAESGNNSPVHSISPVSPLPFSPFKLIVPISPLPPSPVHDREALSPLPNSPFEPMLVDTGTTPKAKTNALQGQSTPASTCTSQDKKTPISFTPVPSFLTPLPPTPNCNLLKHSSSFRKEASSNVNTPCNFHAEVPSGVIVKPKPVCTRTLMASFNEEKVAENEKASSFIKPPQKVDRRTPIARTSQASNRSRRKRISQDQMSSNETPTKRQYKEGRSAKSDDGRLPPSLLDVAANFKMYLSSQQSPEEFMKFYIENVSLDVSVDTILKEAVQVLSKLEVDLLEDVYKRCIKESYEKLDRCSFLPTVEQKILALFRQLFKIPCQESKKPVLMEALWNNIFFQEIPQNNAGKAALCRMFTALCMDMGNVEEVRVMHYYVMIVGYLCWGSLAVAIAMVWPQVFLKGKDIGMVHVIEFILTQSLHSSLSEKNAKIIVCMQKLCGWSAHSETAQKLLKALLEQLQTCTAVDNPSQDRVFELEKCIELLCKTQGWVFIKDEFVRIGLQTLSNKWQAKGRKCDLPVDYVCSILRLTGTLIMKSHTPKMRDVTQILKNWLLPILSKEPSDEMVQAHCIDTILVISPQTPRIISSLHTWYCSHPQPLPDSVVTKMEETRKLLCTRFNVDCSPFLSKKTT